MTATTQPTDSQMLDWMAENEVCISENWAMYHIYSEEWCQLGRYDNIRDAIAAEMAKEVK